MAKESQQQPYDNLLKRLLEGQPTTIIPLLLDDDALQIIKESAALSRESLLQMFHVLVQQEYERLYKEKGGPYASHEEDQAERD